MDRGKVGQLWSSTFVHAGQAQLYSNMSAVLPNLLTMEQQYGSARLGLELGIMTGVAGGLYGE